MRRSKSNVRCTVEGLTHGRHGSGIYSGIVGGAGRFGSVEPLQAIGHSDGLGGGADGSLKPAAAALSGGGRTHAARGPTAASIPDLTI